MPRPVHPVAAPGPRSLADPRLLALLLVGILLWTAAWDLWAVLGDQRVSLGFDCLTARAARVVNNWEVEGLSWLMYGKDPLSMALALLVYTLVGAFPLATRVLSILVHLVLVLQCHDLGRRLGGRPAAGLWAALLCSTTPMIFGWARMDFSDFVVAMPVMLTLQLAARVDLARVVGPLLLGLALAAGLQSKLSFPLYVIGPGLWLAATRVRSWRTARGLLLVAVAALAAVAHWVFSDFEAMIVTLFVGSTTTHPEPASVKALWYLSLPGAAPLAAAATAAGVYLLARGRDVDRWLLWLVLSALLSTAFFLTLVFDYSARYAIPFFPVACVPLGAALGLLPRRWPGWLSRALSAGLSVGLVGVFLWLNLSPPDLTVDRENHAGILSPDRRDFQALARALAWIDQRQVDYLLLTDSMATYEMQMVPLEVWTSRGYRGQSLALHDARQRVASGRPLAVVLVTRRDDPGTPHDFDQQTLDQAPAGVPRDMGQRYRWFRSRPRQRLLGRTSDTFGNVLTVSLVW